MTSRIAAIAAAGLFAAGSAAPALAQGPEPSHMTSLLEGASRVATASFVYNDNAGQGGAVLVETPNGVLLTATIEGLEPGWHGFHIHETGECAPSFQAAGGHWAPDGTPHGFATEEGAHPGDMPNIYANEDGVARVELFLPDLTLGEESLMDGDGSALMVHAGPDDYRDVSSAGDRAACAVIRAANAQ